MGYRATWGKHAQESGEGLLPGVRSPAGSCGCADICSASEPGARCLTFGGKCHRALHCPLRYFPSDFLAAFVLPLQTK